MSTQTDNIISLVRPYGLSEEESKIYLFLLQYGTSTALALSRQLHLGRTKIYRLLDKLITKQLVEQLVDHRGMKFAATHPQKLQHVLDQKEQQINSLKQSLPQVISELENLLPTHSKDSKVKYFQGVEGLKQVSYNLTKAQGFLRVFEMEHLQEFLDQDYAEYIRQKLVDNHITTHDLTNKKSFPDFTQVTQLIKKFSHFRYIDPKLLKINFEVLIYNDVYATYTYKDNGIFCVEIHNPHLAAMQTQLFDFVWHQATPMAFTSPHGAAHIKD